MDELFAFVWVAASGALFAYASLRRAPSKIAIVAGASLALHFVAAALQVLITRDVYAGGDMLDYFAMGAQLSRLLSYDFGRFAPEILRLGLQLEPNLPFPVIGAGNAMGTMAAIGATLHFALGGSLYGTAAAVATFAFFGKLALYRALAADADERLHLAIAVGVLLTPSVVYWSSGLLKESVIIGPLGFLYAYFRTLAVDKRASALLPAFASALVVALIKPYILFAFAAAGGAYLYGERGRQSGRPFTVRPVALFGSLGLVFGAILGLGQLFPEFALENIAAAAAHEQAMGAIVRGGSNYSIGDPMAKTLGGQLAFAPWAVLTALYRPFVFEAHTALSLLSALEVTLALWLTLRAATRMRGAGLLRALLASPMLLFCVAFALSMALPVGLSTTNLGTLVRYRMPLMPFFAVALAAFNADLVARPARASRGPA